MNLAQKLYLLRTTRKLKQEDIAQISGATDSAVSQWELGTRRPRTSYITRICQYFGIDLNSFLDETNDIYDSGIPDNVYRFSKRRIPLIGEIACGDPIIAAESADEYVFIPDEINADFALRCKGDSMIGARIFDGDVVYIRRQPTVENGEIAAVVIEDEEATLKRVYQYPEYIMLQPENPTHRPMVFSNKDADKVRIIGKAVAFTSMIY